MSLTTRTLCALAVLALVAGGALYAAAESAPPVRMTVTYFYLPG